MTPIVYSPPNADTPFLAVGATKGRILVSNGSSPHPPDGTPLLAIPVICKK